jgi:chitinase
MEALKTISCNADLCEDNQDMCDDEAGDDDPTNGYFKRRSYTLSDGTVMWSYDEPWLVTRAVPGRPGSARTMTLNIGRILQSALVPKLEMSSRGYPSGLKLFKGDGVSTLPLMGGFE